jgi:predicted RNA-binding protein YlxR (DUF448 family)
MKNIKERTCIACGQKETKEHLLRWVVFNGKLYPDWTQKLEGRSIYSHHSKTCVEGFYESNRPAKQLSLKKVDFAVGKNLIIKHIEDQALASLNHFFDLGKKSGLILRGQNLVEEYAGKNDDVKVCFCAVDVAERTVKKITEVLGDKLVKINLTKDETGAFFDGRPLGIVAFKESEITEKICFYMNLINKLRSGDIDAH